MNGHEISEIFGCVLLVIGILVILISLLTGMVISGSEGGSDVATYLRIGSATVGLFFIASGALIAWKR
jgi:hypothetical protein